MLAKSLLQFVLTNWTFNLCVHKIVEIKLPNLRVIWECPTFGQINAHTSFEFEKVPRLKSNIPEVSPLLALNISFLPPPKQPEQPRHQPIWQPHKQRRTTTASGPFSKYVLGLHSSEFWPLLWEQVWKMGQKGTIATWIVDVRNSTHVFQMLHNLFNPLPPTMRKSTKTLAKPPN